MRRALLAAIAVSLVGCGGQSAQQRERARVAKCRAQAQQWAQHYTASLGPGVSAQTEQGLAESTAQVCIDSPPKSP